MQEVASRADIAWQDELWVGRTIGGTKAWTQILGIETLGVPEQAPEGVDVTHMQSPGRTRETMPGMMDSVDYAQEMQDWGPDETFLQLLDDLAALTEAGAKEDIEVEFVVGGRRRTYRAYVNAFNPAGTVGEKRMASVAFKIFNRVPNTRVPGGSAAPVNLVPPHIIGTPSIGTLLKAFEGIWDTEGNSAYVWKADGVAILGATGQTFSRTAAQDGKDLTVDVTRTNSIGSTTATSAAKEAV